MQGRTWYLRRYPTGGLVAQTVGYSTIERSRTGLEKSLNDYLTGSNANLRTLFDRTVDTLKGITRQGNDVVTTIDVTAQRTAMEALAGKCGAAVALDPRDGRVLAIASTPTYDPNLAEKNFGQILKIKGPCKPASPLVNRATNDLFIPGSTFKVVTATAALDSGRFTTESTFDDPGYCTEYGKRVSNYADQDGAEVFGRVDFPTAMEHSINSVFCNIGKAIGPTLVLDYAKRYGFYEDPPLETPSEERLRSGLYKGAKLFEPTEPNQVDPGRLAFGQERLLVTPLQMAMVAAAIANGGILMEPHVVDRIVDPDGNVVTRTSPEQYRGGHEGRDGSRPDGHDEARCRVRNGHRRPDSRRSGRRQDRDRRDGPPGTKRHVVHRLRAGRPAACSRGRCSAQPERHGRLYRRTDREGPHPNGPEQGNVVMTGFKVDRVLTQVRHLG